MTTIVMSQHMSISTQLPHVLLALWLIWVGPECFLVSWDGGGVHWPFSFCQLCLSPATHSSLPAWWDGTLGSNGTQPHQVINYRIYLNLLDYFLAVPSSICRGGFKQDGCLFEKGVYCFVYRSNSCSSAIIMLFLAAATALSFKLKSYRSGVSPSVSSLLS